MNSRVERWTLPAVAAAALVLYARPGMADNGQGPFLDPRTILSTWTNSPERLSPFILEVAAAKSEEDLFVMKLSSEGYRLYEQESFLAGVDKFKRALELAPRNGEARLGLATGLIKLGRVPAAIGVLEQMTKDFPRDYRVRNNLAWLYATAADESLRDAAKAVARAQEAVIMAPQDSHVWSTLSEAHFVAGNYRRATGAAAAAFQMAQKERASAAKLKEYRHQWTRCRDAMLTEAREAAEE